MYDSSIDGSALVHLSDHISDSGSGWMEVGAEVSQIRNVVDRQDHTRFHVPLFSRSNKIYG